MVPENIEILLINAEAARETQALREKVEASGLKEFLIRIAEMGCFPDLFPNAVPGRTYAEGGSDGPWDYSNEWQTQDNNNRFIGTKSVDNNQTNLAWHLIYEGGLENGANQVEIYDFLTEALLQPDPDFPIRGPKHYENGLLTYYLDISPTENSLSCFEVVENIEKDGMRVYSAKIYGNAIYDDGV